MKTLLSCPLHGSDSQVSFGVRSGFALNRCTQCGLVYLAALPHNIDRCFYDDTCTGDANLKNKDAIEYWSFPSYYIKHRSVFEFFFASRLNRILKACPGAQSLLDIGCGYGFFLDYAQKRLPRVLGVELDPQVARAALAAGLPVLNQAAEALVGEETYDCIVLCDVLEHLQDPLAVLRLCHRLLNPGGVLYVQVPNLLGFKLPLGHSWGLPHHLWQFGPRSLQMLLEAAGFGNVAHETGVLGVVGVLERGGPTLRNRLEWLGARWFRCGNRLQSVGLRSG